MYGKKEYAHINALLNQKLEEKKHLIAVHRGTWHGNTRAELEASIREAIEACQK